jgi:hypothetical protein
MAPVNSYPKSPTGMEHSPTSATGTAWERTPWHATTAGGVGGAAEGQCLTDASTDMGRAREGQRETSERRGGQAMMRLGRRASLRVAFYLLTFAATAECAWGLWQARPALSK